MSVGFQDEDTVDILFEGTKYFGTTQTLFHIALVEHTSHDTIEIISYDKRHAVEAPRLYLVYSALLARLDKHVLNRRIQALRDESLERGINTVEEKFVKIATGELLFDFLSARLFAVTDAKARLEFKLLRKDPYSASAPNPLGRRLFSTPKSEVSHSKFHFAMFSTPKSLSTALKSELFRFLSDTICRCWQDKH
jgi:hypothetical protein